MPPPLGRQDAGAPGGFWEVIDEASCADAVRQATRNSCGPACGEMLFRSRGIESVTQAMIVAAQNSERSEPALLAEAMNRLLESVASGVGGRWLGDWLNTTQAPTRVFAFLSRHGTFLTSLKSFGSASHMVVVDGKDAAGRIIVRDPFEGTRYSMTWAAFEAVWQGMCVWWDIGGTP